MALKEFKSLASYKIIDHLYDDRKDFIILGLCGRVGSGVSTISGILEKNFDELQLPLPGYSESDTMEDREYRIIYAYAKKNWHSFYKIRTSALITRYILDYDIQQFCDYIVHLSGNESIRCRVSEIANEFFNKEMECDWENYFLLHDKMQNEKLSSPWNLLVHDELFEDLKQRALHPENRNDSFEIKLQFKEESNCEGHAESTDSEIKLKVDPDKQKCYFRNCEMSKLLKKYAECRSNKSGFKNPFWFIVLKKYLYDFLPMAAAKLWKDLQEESQSLPTLALQCLGNNLRISKQPFYNSSMSDTSLCKDGYECLAEEINLAIKVLRAYQLKHKQVQTPDYDTRVYRKNAEKEQEVRTVIVIDSIKNPYESLYLKARYNNYYLIGVYTEERERYKRLREREHFVNDDIRAIDMIENNSSLKKGIKSYAKYLEDGEKGDCDTPEIIKKLYKQFEDRGLLDNLEYISPFILQNVTSCLEAADILVNNITDNNSYMYLKKTLLRYVSLMMNPGLVLPTPVERCMQVAYTAKLNSGCISRQVGAVLTDAEYHLLSMGWNQQPEGQVPCAYRNLCELYHHWDDAAYSEYERDDEDKFQKAINDQVKEFWDTQQCPIAEKGKIPNYCFKDYQNSIDNDKNQVHTRALHAEETAFLNLGPNREHAKNGILFTTSSPCELCAKKAKYMGIAKIYYVETYAGVSKKHVLNVGKVWPEFILFTGAIGTAYNKLFTPLIPRKDENEMWLGKWV